MVEAWQWLNWKYPNELTKQKVENLAANLYTVEGENAFKIELEDFLNISDFVILKQLYLYDNKLTKLVVINCPEIKLISCGGNLLTDLDFLFGLDSKKLTYLNLEDNNISERDLSCFRRFTSLNTLLIGNSDQDKIRRGIYNRFVGSLKFLQKLKKMVRLSINNTDIDSGLEYLPESVEEFHCLADKREKSRVKIIEKELEPFLISTFRGTYDFDEWKNEKNVRLPVLSSGREQIYNTSDYTTNSEKGKEKATQREIQYQERDLETNSSEQEQQQFQQIETNYYKTRQEWF